MPMHLRSCPRVSRVCRLSPRTLTVDGLALIEVSIPNPGRQRAPRRFMMYWHSQQRLFLAHLNLSHMITRTPTTMGQFEDSEQRHPDALQAKCLQTSEFVATNQWLVIGESSGQEQ